MTSKPTSVALVDEGVERNADGGHRAHLGASIIGGHCDRAIWYTFFWCQVSTFSGRMLRLFQRGHDEEPRIIEWLRQAGIEIVSVNPNTGEQYRFKDVGGHMGGAMDGAGKGFVESPDEWMVAEFKTSGDRAFKDLVKNGVEKSKPQHHGQTNLYMHWTGMKKAFYLVVNKNDDTLYQEIIEYDQNIAERLINKARTIITSDTPPEKISDNPGWYQCKWCDFNNICHGTDLPEVNCRTCIHATAELDGDARWSCAVGSKFGTTCDKHLYKPSLLSFATIQSADQAKNTIEYRKETGATFANGPGFPAYRSTEIKACGSELIGEDKAIDMFREKFDGRIICK